MKKFFCGILVGALLFGSTCLWAASPVASVVNYQILLNGSAFNPRPPAMVINGTTYLPLRVLSNALNVPITWNETLRQVEIGSAAAPSGSGYHRSNPAPLNQAQTIHLSNYAEEYTATVTLLEAKRGLTAWELIKAANANNEKPDEGYEYILAKISVKADLINEDKAISIGKYDFECFSSQGEEYAAKTVTAPKPILSGKLFSGGMTEGYLVFQVKTTDLSPKLVYGMDQDGTGGIWFKLG